MNYIDNLKLKRFIIILVLFSLFANPVIGFKLSKTAPYSDIPEQGIPNWGGKDLEFIQAGHNDRIRQNGTIYQIRFSVANASRLKQFNFTIWRQNGSNFDRIATTNNLIDNISTGINVINLSSPIEGIQEGDFYGYRVKSSSNALYVNPGVTNHLTYSVVGGATSYTNYNWNAQVISANVFVIEPYMEHPYMVFIGNSIMSGWPGHISFIHSSNIINIYSSIENYWARKVNKSYQNMGYIGDMTGQLNSRFNSDVVNLTPEFALIEGGINDINSNSGYSKETVLANWESMVKKAHYNNITPVIMLILPDSRKSDAIMRNITYINEQLIKLGANYSPSIIVDARCYIGINRPSGPAGNCWTIKPSYTTDGLHYNSAGNERIAQAIKDSFRLVHGKPGLYNLIQPDSTIIYSTNLSNAINTSWRMASTEGSANVSYHIPSSGELANLIINSGTIDWFKIDNLSSNPVCSLYSNVGQMDSKEASNNSVNFTNDMSPGTYYVQCTLPQSDINTPPSITSVQTGSVSNTWGIVQFTVNQSNALTHIKYSINSNLADVSNTSNQDSGIVRSENIPGLNTGTKYYYSVYAWNFSNNSLGTNSSIYNFTTKSNVIIPIVITIISPENNSINRSGFVNVTVKLTRTGTAFLNWEGSNESMIGEGKSFYKNKTGLFSGNYSFRVYGNDSTGVFNGSETRMVTVDRTIIDTTIGNYTNTKTFIVNTTLKIASPSGNTTLIIPNDTKASLAGASLMSISIDSVAKMNTIFTANLGGNDIFIGENVTFGPSGAVFDPAIRIRFNYTDAQIAVAGISESDLAVEYFNITSNNLESLVIFERNTTENYLLVNISHFGTVALIGTTATATSPLSGSGSSGGGGGGGTSGENYTNIEVIEKYDLQISKDVLTSFRFIHEKNPIMFVDIMGNTSIGIITTSAEVLKNTSTLVRLVPEWLVYKNVNIWVGTSGFANPKNIKQAMIKFRVENSWMSSNNIKSRSIKMIRWDGSKWDQLETSYQKDDDTYTYYDAKTNVFSNFAITGVEKKESITENVGLSEKVVIIESTKPAATIQTEEKPSDFRINWFIIIGLFFGIGLIIKMYLWMKKK